MRRHVLSVSVFVVALSGGAASVAWPQAQELALRGPRFVAAWKPSAEALDASNAVVLRRRVSLDLTNATADEALKEITRQADLEISYSTALLPTGRSVSLHARAITVAAALTEVLLDAGVDVAVARGGHMALVKRPASAAVPVVDSGVVFGRVTDKETGTPIVGAAVAIEGTRHAATTGSDGGYRIANVLAGTYEVRARYIGYAPMVATITVNAAAEVAADFALEKALQLLDELVTVTPGGIQTEVRALPSPVTVITAEQIEELRSPTINNVIRQAVPGAVSFEVSSQPFAATFSARGATSLYGAGTMKVLVDGVEVSNYTTNPTDPSSIERIEVIRGPQAATLYGPDAAGGVVQIFTKRGDPSSRHGEVTVRAEGGILQTPYTGYDGVLRTSVGAEAQGGIPGASYLIGASWWRLPDWIAEGTSPSRQTAPSVYGGLRAKQGIVSVDLSGRYTGVNNWLNLNPQFLQTGLPSLTEAALVAQRTDVRALGARLGIEPFDWWRTRLTVGFDEVVFDGIQDRPRRTTPEDTLLSLSRTHQTKSFVGLNTAVTWKPTSALATTITAGADYYRLANNTNGAFGTLTTTGTIELDPGGFIFLNDAVVTNTGYFGQIEVGAWDRLFLTTGLRADVNSTFGQDLATPLAPRIGVAYSRDVGSVAVKGRLAYGRAIRAAAPGLTFGFVNPSVIQLANPLLRPERQRGWDGGFDLVIGTRGSLSVSAYDQTAEDLILSVQVATEPVRTTQFQNVGRVKNRGVELEGRVRLLSDRVELRGQYAYTDSKIADVGPDYNGLERAGERPVGVPAHTAGASLSARVAWRTRLTGGLTYVGSWRQLDELGLLRCFGGTGPCIESGDYRNNYPGFVKLNATVTQQLQERLQAWLTVTNLTNSRAFESTNGVPVQGRLTVIGAQYTF